MATYAEPGADIVGQEVTVHLSLTLPNNRSTWLKNAKAMWKKNPVNLTYMYNYLLLNLYNKQCKL